MKNALTSIVILHWAQGFTAHIRFSDPTDDVDLSSNSHFQIYYLVQKHVDKVVGLYDN